MEKQQNQRKTRQDDKVSKEEDTVAPLNTESTESFRSKAKANLFSVTPSDDRKIEKISPKRVSYAQEEEIKKIQKEHLNKLNVEMENIKQNIAFLLPMIKSESHKNIQNWVKKFQPVDDIAMMQHYILFLHYLKENVERGKLQFPFTKLPPHDLDGLNCYIEPLTFKRLHDQYESSINYTMPIKELHATAKEFFSRQPKPISGIYCYAIAFSDSKEE